MKKYFYLAAVSAMMLTACSSEKDVLETKTGPAKQEVTQKAVGFDVYVPAATAGTRAGLEGTMTTGRMQRSEYEGGGFGVYAYQVQDENTGDAATKYEDWMTRTTPAKAPNFMANEKLLWNATNQGWYYNPLKYWPNETDKDSQTSPAEMIGSSSTKHLDRLSFFAYAPYVESADDTKPGIRYITNNAGKLTKGNVSAIAVASDVLEPSIGYTASLDDPNQAVDLLWGVAPSGGLEYTAVNGQTVKVEEGMPLIDMTKPNVNTSMKFLFQHALARIGVTAVAAVDQVGAGGKLDPNTKITIEKITLTGYFGETGLLNLDNTIPSVANWEEANGKVISSTDFSNLVKTTLTLQANHSAPLDGQAGTIATHLQWVDNGDANPDAQTNRSGVTTIKQSVIQPALIDNTPGKNRNWYTGKEYKVGELAYSETTPYYTDPDCKNLLEFTMPISYTVDSKGVYKEQATANTHFTYPMVLQNYFKSTTGFQAVTPEEVNAKTYDSYQAYSNYKEKGSALAVGDYVYMSDALGYKQIDGVMYSVSGNSSKTALTKLDDGVYIPVSGAPRTGDYVIKDNGMWFYQLKAENAADFVGQQLYQEAPARTFTPMAVGTNPVKNLFVLCGSLTKCVPTNTAQATYYKRDANYFMVVPTNNFVNMRPSLDANEKDLRTVRVMIEYYITTEDGKLANGRAQTKNVIEKDVVFPSIANGKSYNLNLVLGLTSVKMEAEVDDWKVINVQGDLPQNTAD